MSLTRDNDPMHDAAMWSRRRFLSTSAMGLTVVGLAGSLAACTGSKASTNPREPAGPAKRGGTLRIGAQGGASTDSLDAHNPLTNTDFVRLAQIYDPLVRLDNSAQPELVLAKSITPNATATEWTISIPSGIVTHNGKPFTSADVLHSLNRIVTQKFPGAVTLGPIDIKSSKTVNETTLILKYSKPYSVLIEALSLSYLYMVPRNYDPKRPDGTGPFKFKTFTPGVESTFVRNDNYWQSGKPYLDAIVTTNIADETSQVNGLQAGQVDVINFLSAGSVATLRGSGQKVIISKTAGWGPFTMRVDQKPFDDVRVRQAFRLIIDRPQMLKQVFGGYGAIGNDVFGTYDKDFPTDLPQRVQDIPQAISLLKAAGHDGLTVNLVTTPNAPGMISAAQVFATQAKAANVTVKITQQTTTDYFASSYLKTTFSQDYWATPPFLPAVSQGTLGGAPFSATHFNDPEYNALYAKATSTTDAAAQKDFTQKMMRIDYERGGNIIPYFFPTVDACTPKVQGISESANGFSPGGNDFKNFWLS